jgi:DNA-binding transcriptional LysR family regulator
MDPRHLVQLATILEKGSITQASQHLHLTQPTLTHNMQTLEMQAGGTLFERSRFGVRSTPMGELLAREGRAIARRLKDAAEVSARHRSGLNSQIRLGTGPLVGAALLPGLTEWLLLDQPQLALTVQSDRPHLLLDQLVDGRHDLVIAPSWLDRPPPGIERFLLMKDDLGVFCGPTHPLASQGVLRKGEGDALSWISLGTASPFDQDIRKMLTAAGVVHARTEITLLGEAFMLLRILVQGKHLAVLPRMPVLLLKPYFPLVALALQTQPQARNIYLWCKSTLLEDPVFVAMKESILGYAARLAGASVPNTD